MEEYVEATAGLPIVKTLFMEVDVAEEDIDKEASAILELCRQDTNLMAGMIIGARPASVGFPEYLEKWAEKPEVKGFRQILHADTPKGFCLTPEFVRGIRLIGETGRTFDVCIRPDEIADVYEMARLCSNTRFVLDHMGNPETGYASNSDWAESIKSLSKLDNVSCKISGSIVTVPVDSSPQDTLKFYVETCREAFGNDRILFGGDWPVCTKRASLRQWIETLGAITSSWTIGDREKLFHDNAVRTYGV